MRPIGACDVGRSRLSNAIPEKRQDTLCFGNNKSHTFCPQCGHTQQVVERLPSVAIQGRMCVPFRGNIGCSLEKMCRFCHTLFILPLPRLKALAVAGDAAALCGNNRSVSNRAPLFLTQRGAAPALGIGRARSGRWRRNPCKARRLCRNAQKINQTLLPPIRRSPDPLPFFLISLPYLVQINLSTASEK